MPSEAPLASGPATSSGSTSTSSGCQTRSVVFRFRDEQGRLVALRMRRQQFQTFANRADELAEALEGET
jgi:hypothetical protein